MTNETEQAWTGAQLQADPTLFVTLDAPWRDALLAATAHARACGRPLEAVRREDFPLEPLSTWLQDLRRTVLQGRGIVILRGLPVENLSEEDVALMFWGLGTHLGRAVSQSLMGDRLGHVRDVSAENPNERGYRSRSELSFHTDSDDLLAMLCIRPAREGGVSRFASAHTLQRVLEREAPALLARLQRGYRYHWRGEQASGEPPITDYRVPVLSSVDGRLACVFLRRFIEMADDDLGQLLTDGDRAALDAVERVAGETCLEYTLQAGEAVLLDNLTVLHSRTEFVDHEEPARRRHLLRLWLKCDDAQPRVDAVRRFYREDGIEAREGGSTLYVHRAQA